MQREQEELEGKMWYSILPYLKYFSDGIQLQTVKYHQNSKSDFSKDNEDSRDSDAQYVYCRDLYYNCPKRWIELRNGQILQLILRHCQYGVACGYQSVKCDMDTKNSS